MSLLNLIGITTAYAATTAATAAPATGQQPSTVSGFLSMLPMLIAIIAVFYFLLVRPQQKRSREQRSLMEGLAIGDEVMTTGGIAGRLTKMRDNFIVLSISKEVEIVVQKNAIATILPKGTLDSVEK